MTDQTPVLLGQVAGYIGFRTVAMGLRSGMIAALASSPDGVDAEELARSLGLDPFYVSVWCRAALAAGICDGDDARYRLAAHMDTLLLDTDAAAHVGSVFEVMGQPEMFDRFEASLASGERMWWDDTSPEWIAGVDGDAQSLDLAHRRVEEAGVGDRVTLIEQPLEELHLEMPATVVINNISMHECRDIDVVTERVRAALERGGWFVISDFPFPDTTDGLRTPAGRIMSGIQFFEAQIDDQLLPRAVYDELLMRHDFRELGSIELTPLHAVTHARA